MLPREWPTKEILAGFNLFVEMYDKISDTNCPVIELKSLNVEPSYGNQKLSLFFNYLHCLKNSCSSPW